MGGLTRRAREALSRYHRLHAGDLDGPAHLQLTCQQFPEAIVIEGASIDIFHDRSGSDEFEVLIKLVCPSLPPSRVDRTAPYLIGEWEAAGRAARHPSQRGTRSGGASTTAWMSAEHGSASSTGRRDLPPPAIQTLAAPRAGAQQERSERTWRLQPSSWCDKRGGSLSRRHHRPMLGCLAARKTETPP
jgi:hypothetical protein